MLYWIQKTVKKLFLLKFDKILLRSCLALPPLAPLPGRLRLAAGLAAPAPASPRAPRQDHARARASITLSEARSRLDQRRFSHPNTHFAAFFKIYTKIIFSQANLQNIFSVFFKISQNFAKIMRTFSNFSEKLQIFYRVNQFAEVFAEFAKSCRF